MEDTRTDESVAPELTIATASDTAVTSRKPILVEIDLDADGDTTEQLTGPILVRHVPSGKTIVLVRAGSAQADLLRLIATLAETISASEKGEDMPF